MKNMDKARLIIDRLNKAGADLRGVSPRIIAEALDEIDAQAAADYDPYMPTDEEWADNPWAEFAATDGDGEMWLYDKEPSKGIALWLCDERGRAEVSLKWVTPPVDWRTTKRMRPSHL